MRKSAPGSETEKRGPCSQPSGLDAPGEPAPHAAPPPKGPQDFLAVRIRQQNGTFEAVPQTLITYQTPLKPVRAASEPLRPLEAALLSSFRRKFRASLLWLKCFSVPEKYLLFLLGHSPPPGAGSGPL